MNSNTTFLRLYKDTLNKWDAFKEIIFDSKAYIDAKLKVASDPMNNNYCYDLILAGNDIFKSYLSKCSSYYKKMMEVKKEFDKAYRANKTSAKLQEGLENYNFKNQIENMEKLNAIIRSNNELIDVLQAEMIHTNKYNSSEYKNSESMSSESKSTERKTTEGKTTEYNAYVEYDYITKLTGIHALDDQTTNISDITQIDNTPPNKRVKQMTAVQTEALNLFTKKNHDYGDAFATYGPTGVIVRIGDKIQRLQSITRTGITMVNDESIRDTLMDLHNYCAMAIMLMDEDKEKDKKKEHVSNTTKNIVFNEPGFGTYTVDDLSR
jgi:hypothetical protein